MTSTSAPLRITVIAIRRPIASANMSRCRSWALVTGLPAAVSSRSPVRSPARAAGPPGTTSTTRSPVAAPALSRSGEGSGAGMLTRPRYARRTRPSCMSAAMIRLVVALTGTARPTPAPATAVLMPTTRAWLSASAPPEFPGFSAASVWITSSISRAAEPLRVGSDRPRPLTTPAVTEPARPSGLPSATTSWPTTSSVRLAEFRRRRRLADRPEHGEIGERIRADHAERRGGAIGERGGPRRRLAPDMRVGQQEPVTGVDDGRAEALAAAAIGPLRHSQARHLARELGRYPGPNPRIRIQRGISCHVASEHCDYIITVNIRHWGEAY